ncbi:MAG: hypothetical protein GY866_23705 [Proteobacteria bacterium]|nr:hypothetical protein [Pseudomonadota bacterium]
MNNNNGRQTESDINTKLIWEQLMYSKPGPNNAQLCHLIMHSQQLGDLAMEQLLLQNPSNGELYMIMREGKPEYKVKAYEQFLLQDKQTYDYIVAIIIQIVELRESAWKKLLDLVPQGKDLRLIAESVDALKEACWEIILTQQISNDELIHLMADSESLRTQSWEKLMQRDHSSRELCRIIEHVGELRQKAWNELMQRGATNAELRYLMEHVPSIRELAKYKLHKDTEEIMRILNGLH